MLLRRFILESEVSLPLSAVSRSETEDELGASPKEVEKIRGVSNIMGWCEVSIGGVEEMRLGFVGSIFELGLLEEPTTVV